MKSHNFRRDLVRLGACSIGMALAIALSPAMLAQAADVTASVKAVDTTVSTNQVTLYSTPIGSRARTSAVVAAFAGNPYGCFGKSTYPHISQHYPDRVSADGITGCSVGLPYMHVESWLYRQDCVLFFCWWTQVGHDSKTTSLVAAQDHPNHTCNGTSNHRYRIESYHEVHDGAGGVYTGDTANEQNVNCG